MVVLALGLVVVTHLAAGPFTFALALVTLTDLGAATLTFARALLSVLLKVLITLITLSTLTTPLARSLPIIWADPFLVALLAKAASEQPLPRLARPTWALFANVTEPFFAPTS